MREGEKEREEEIEEEEREWKEEEKSERKKREEEERWMKGQRREENSGVGLRPSPAPVYDWHHAPVPSSALTTGSRYKEVFYQWPGALLS